MAENQTHPGTIDRLYVLNAGIAVAPDRSVYSPGKWKDKQTTLIGSDDKAFSSPVTACLPVTTCQFVIK